MSHTTEYIADAARILAQFDAGAIDKMVGLLADLRELGGRSAGFRSAPSACGTQTSKGTRKCIV